MKLLKSILSSPQAGSILKGGYAVVKNQPAVAPVLAGGSIAAALGMILVGGYGVFDCIRFQTKHGQCDESVKQDGGMLAAGFVMLLGNWGSFNTYNKKLHAEDSISPLVETRELVEDFPVAPVFNQLVTEIPEPSKEEIMSYMESGATQEEAAKFFNTTRYRIRKALETQENARKRDRGR